MEKQRNIEFISNTMNKSQTSIIGVSLTEMLTLRSQRLVSEDTRSPTSNISATSSIEVLSSFQTTDLLWLIVSTIFLSQGLNSSRIFSLSSSQNGEENFTRTSVLLFKANGFFPLCSSKYFKMGAHPKSLLRIEIFIVLVPGCYR